MSQSRLIVGSIAEVAGIGLAIWGGTQGNTVALIAGIIIAVGGGVFTLTSILLNQLSPSRNGGFTPPQRGTERDGTSEFQETFDATVTKIRNTNAVRGVNQFSTEITVDVERGGFASSGLIRTYLTPAEIATLAPGTSIQVAAVDGSSERYTLILDD